MDKYLISSGLMKQLKIKQLADGLTFSRTEVLGKGAFGEVYLGFDDTRKAPCAFKIINLQKLSTQVNSETLLKKIKDEIVNMQIARHESIIEFYYAKQSTSKIYIVCEYCNGESLAQYIQRRQYLTESEAMGFFREILKGFAYLHANKMVHRDLKPANLLLHNFSIKIADLGFSKVTEDHEQMLESIVGTPLYMSPQIFQRQGYTQKTDIWSLGCILFEMLYGRNPWVGCKNLFELRDRINKEVVFPSTPFVSNEVKQAIKKMLVVRQAERVSWEGLFMEFLDGKSRAIEVESSSSYVPSIGIIDYFKESFNLQSHLQLPKLAKQFKLLPQAQMNELLGVYSSSEQFYSQILFSKQNKSLIGDYFKSYLEKRNEISYMIVMMEKAVAIGQSAYLQLSVFCNCLAMLSYRYSMTILQQLVVGDRLVVLEGRFQSLAGKFYYQQLLLLLLQRDLKIIREEYISFKPFFEAMMSRIKTHSISAVIQKDLSGIYGSSESDKRVIKFFTLNYLKKIFNILKDIVKAPETMVSEKEQKSEERPPAEVCLVKMIGSYLSNGDMFSIGQVEKKNLSQLLYDWETSVREHFYQELQESQPLKEDSIDSFIKKEIVWRQMLLPQFR